MNLTLATALARLESKGNLIRHHEQQANGTAAAKIKGS